MIKYLVLLINRAIVFCCYLFNEKPDEDDFERLDLPDDADSASWSCGLMLDLPLPLPLPLFLLVTSSFDGAGDAILRMLADLPLGSINASSSARSASSKSSSIFFNTDSAE